MLATKENPNPEAQRSKRTRWRPGWMGTLLFLGLGFFSVNFLVQIYRKPTELLRFARLGRPKTPQQTWSEFGEDFRRHATSVITADFLAALVQVESSGDPLSSPAWRWHWLTSPWGLYGPPSTAVGLLQITEGNFGLARTLCVKAGRVAKEGAWYDPEACKLTILYSRLLGSHSIEMTSAFLHFNVQKIVARLRRPVSLRDKQKLAAVIHLCGPGKGPAFVRSKFNADALGTCGTQPVGSYVRLAMKYRAQFSQMAAAEAGDSALRIGSADRPRATLTSVTARK